MASNPEQASRLLTIEQAAERVGLSPVTVRRRVYAGEIPAVKLGNAPNAPVRIDSAELEEWIYADPRDAA